MLAVVCFVVGQTLDDSCSKERMCRQPASLNFHVIAELANA
jgi:hypothetical protein